MKRAISKVTTPGRWNYTTYLILIICFPGLLALSCKKDDGPPPPVREISQEIRELIYFRGDEKAETVLINVQSGPSAEFAIDEVEDIVNDYNTTSILTVNVHQAQTLTPGILQGNDFTLDQAINHNAESIEMLSKVINYFKAQDRTVYVFAGSFGAFVAQDLIAKKGVSVADKYLIAAGRLDMNAIIWQAAAEGKLGYFENGVDPVILPEPEMDVVERNLNRIAAGFAMNRYTQLFDTFDDLSQITYIYGENDEAVGSLTAAEVRFLQSKNARIIIGSGGHDDTLSRLVPQGMNLAFGIQ